MEGSEGVMMKILGWDTMEDLQDFLLRKGTSGGALGSGDVGRRTVSMMRSETGNSSQTGSRMVSNTSAMSRANS